VHASRDISSSFILLLPQNRRPYDRFATSSRVFRDSLSRVCRVHGASLGQWMPRRRSRVAATIPPNRHLAVHAFEVGGEGIYSEDDFFFDMEMAPELDDGPPIDYSSVGLYIVAIQVVVATFATSAVSVLCAWLLPNSDGSALRTLMLSLSLGLLIVRWPLVVGRARGLGVVFAALRPAVALYSCALIAGQLLRGCNVRSTATDDGAATARAFAGRTVVTGALLLGGALRARRPRAETDTSFLIALATLCVSALVPIWDGSGGGPLCEAASFFEACERVIRATLFASLYATHVYAAAPEQNNAHEITICVARATAASVWSLCAVHWVVPFALLQMAVVLLNSMRTSRSPSHTDAYSAMYHSGAGSANQDSTEVVPLAGTAFSPLDLAAPNVDSGLFEPKRDVATRDESPRPCRPRFEAMPRYKTFQACVPHFGSHGRANRAPEPVHSALDIEEIIARESARSDLEPTALSRTDASAISPG
jgi:hypothetical protein